MKLVRFGPIGEERPGLIDPSGGIRDLSGEIGDVAGDALSDAALDRLRGLDVETLPPVEGTPRLGPCVGSVGKVVCIGLNYSDHAAEAGMDVPPEPIVFMKATSALCGPDDGIELPRGSTATDWEVELAVVIGRHAKNIAEAEAFDHIAGYSILNDVSERDFQIRHSGQWVKGKSHDTFGPLGPWLVTRDEVPDPQILPLHLDLNGTRMQEGTTATMVYSVAFLVAYLSRFMSLHPGDVIATGTPPGVGMGQKPDPVYLKPGDRLDLGIAGLGTQRQTVRASA
ncbi:fumarylacetoacetate hydrolase family protein [Stappia sp.]|uniref:fumarylacetoacetate hydrolase family protein n=1 Tax=Stappia sp. TaxID=1870903 RepID=UPI0032D8DF9C